MLLVAVATGQEIEPLQHSYANQRGIKFLITGVGPVVAAANLGKYLAVKGSLVHGVLNIGVAGAYVDSGLELLDICLARQEVIGDFGICMQDEILDFDPGFMGPNTPVAFKNILLERLTGILQVNSIPFKFANFVTVNCCSGTRKRGDFLQQKFSAGCENMEGAGVAMVCNNFNIPCVEMRCVSNTVEDRNMDTWLLDEAIAKICKVTRILLHDYLKVGLQEK
jgi:futalosine hydrolase